MVTDRAMFLVSSPFFCLQGLGVSLEKVFLAACLLALWSMRLLESECCELDVPENSPLTGHIQLGCKYIAGFSIPRSVFNLTFGFQFNVWF